MGNLGPYRVLYNVYNVHKMNITKNKIVGFKTYVQ